MNDITKIQLWNFLQEVGFVESRSPHKITIYRLALDAYIVSDNQQVVEQFYARANEPLLTPLIVENAGSLLCELLSYFDSDQKQKFYELLKDHELQDSFLHYTSRALTLGIASVYWKSRSLDNIYKMFEPDGLLDIRKNINQERFLNFFSQTTTLDKEETKKPTFTMFCKLFENKEKFNLSEEFVSELFCCFVEKFKIKQVKQRNKFNTIYESMKEKDFSPYFRKYPVIKDLFYKETEDDIFIKEKTLNLLEITDTNLLKNAYTTAVFTSIFNFLKEKAEVEPLIKDFYVLPKDTNSQKLLVTFTKKDPFIERFLNLPMTMFEEHEKHKNITGQDFGNYTKTTSALFESLYLDARLIQKSSEMLPKQRIKI